MSTTKSCRCGCDDGLVGFGSDAEDNASEWPFCACTLCGPLEGGLRRCRIRCHPILSWATLTESETLQAIAASTGELPPPLCGDCQEHYLLERKREAVVKAREKRNADRDGKEVNSAKAVEVQTDSGQGEDKRSIACAKEEFWNSTFDVEWLGVETDTHLQVELQRRVDKINNPDPTIRWWYNVELHLRQFCRQYYEFHGIAPTPRVIFDLCYRQSVCKRRCPRELFPELSEVNSITHSLVETELHASLFNEVSFVCTRDLGCDNLGMSVKEVLGTLLCMTRHDEYCECGWGECGRVMRRYGLKTQVCAQTWS